MEEKSNGQSASELEIQGGKQIKNEEKKILNLRLEENYRVLLWFLHGVEWFWKTEHFSTYEH